MIIMKNIRKVYHSGKPNENEVFNDFDFNLKKGEMLAIMGRSGSGKSTLLSIIAGLASIDTGEYYFNGEKVCFKDAIGSHQFRKENIGMVVQNFALLHEYTVYQNVALALKQRCIPKRVQHEMIYENLEKLGLKEKINNLPSELSGGECQRAAIARAIITSPPLLIADEPTGSLDEKTEGNILDIFTQLNQQGMTIIIATHNQTVAQNCSRLLTLI